jgi:hypothetical protein
MLAQFIKHGNQSTVRFILFPIDKFINFLKVKISTRPEDAGSGPVNCEEGAAYD